MKFVNLNEFRIFFIKNETDIDFPLNDSKQSSI